VIPRSLTSQDQVTRLFPASSPLYPLVAPTFDTVRQRLDGLCISSIWIDADLDPSRAGYRPSYDGLHGRGSSTMMPFIASWMSTGPGHEGRGNQVLFLDTIDRSLVDYALEIGLLGEHSFVSSLDELNRAVLASGKKLYSIDDIGTDFDEHVVISTQLSKWLNSKDELASITAFAPRELIKDMHEVTLDDYHAIHAPGCRVFLKTNNTETAGLGVQICNDADEFKRHLDAIREQQRQFSLNKTLIIQREILGRNRSFNLFIDPATPDCIQVTALTDQLVEADGKTYRASVNYPITAANLEHIGPAIMDMIGRIWARHPEAFGFVMCDFFETSDGQITIYDPGIRPSGNTATAMARLLARKLTGRDSYTSNFFLDIGEDGLDYAELRRRLGPLSTLEHLAQHGEGVLPWGWNALCGRGLLIGVAPDEAAYAHLMVRIREATGAQA
jgi:hypothetical protein